MRWTIWQRRTLCSNCGARLTVPDAGLTTRCEFCHTEQAVPDIEQRRAALHKTLQGSSAADRRRIEAELQRAAQLEHYARTAGAISGLVRGLLVTGLLLGAAVLLLHLTGVLQKLTEPLYGDPGHDHRKAPQQRVQELGYRAAGKVEIRGYFLAPKKVYLELQRKHCYAVVLGSGQPIAEVSLLDPRRRRASRHRSLRFHDTTVHCPRQSGAYTLKVKLAESGRFSYQLFRGKKPIDVSEPSLNHRRRHRRRRFKGEESHHPGQRRRHQRRRHRGRDKTSKAAAKPKTTKAAAPKAAAPKTTAPKPLAPAPQKAAPQGIKLPAKPKPNKDDIPPPSAIPPDDPSGDEL